MLEFAAENLKICYTCHAIGQRSRTTFHDINPLSFPFQFSFESWQYSKYDAGRRSSFLSFFLPFFTQRSKDSFLSLVNEIGLLTIVPSLGYLELEQAIIKFQLDLDQLDEGAYFNPIRGKSDRDRFLIVQGEHDFSSS